MNPIKATLTIFMALYAMQFLVVGEAHAQGMTLNAAQVQTLLVGKYACGSTSGSSWDEILSGGASGTVTDYKQGPTDSADPSAVVGSYTIDPSTFTIVYTYGSGSYSYAVVDPTGTTYPNPGNYFFVGLGGAPFLSVTVASSPCQPHRS